MAIDWLALLPWILAGSAPLIEYGARGRMSPASFLPLAAMGGYSMWPGGMATAGAPPGAADPLQAYMQTIGQYEQAESPSRWGMGPLSAQGGGPALPSQRSAFRPNTFGDLMAGTLVGTQLMQMARPQTQALRPPQQPGPLTVPPGVDLRTGGGGGRVLPQGAQGREDLLPRLLALLQQQRRR